MITTQEIAATNGEQDPSLQLSIDTYRDFGENSIASSSEIIELSPEHKAQAETVALECLDHFPTEPTLVERNLGVASLLVRLDCTVTEDGVQVFECEERPAGIGVTELVLRDAGFDGFAPAIHEHFQDYFDVSPVIARHPDAKINDDGVMFDVIEIGSELAVPEKPLIARGEPTDFADQSYCDQLVEWSVSTVMTKGQKLHTASIPSLRAQIATPDNIPSPETSFTIKPVTGSKARGVFIYLSPHDRTLHGKHGTRTHTKVADTVGAHPEGTFLLEEFKPPIRVRLPDEKVGNLILRLFALVHPGEEKTASIIGGSYVARQELVVHGASNAINGPVTVA